MPASVASTTIQIEKESSTPLHAQSPSTSHVALPTAAPVTAVKPTETPLMGVDTRSQLPSQQPIKAAVDQPKPISTQPISTAATATPETAGRKASAFLTQDDDDDDIIEEEFIGWWPAVLVVVLESRLKLMWAT